MKLLKIIRDEEFVRIRHVTDDAIMAREEIETTSHEAPLAAFDTSLQALACILTNILELPDDYSDGLTVTSLRIKRTKSGTRSVEIGATKALNAVDGPHRFKTPLFNIDQPSEKEQGARECSPEQTKLIEAFIAEAEKYQNGDRQQRLLPLVDEEVADADQVKIPGTEDN